MIALMHYDTNMEIFLLAPPLPKQKKSDANRMGKKKFMKIS